MIKTVDITKTRTVSIGYLGENNALTLRFIVPSEYADGDIYLDWRLPNGVESQTPKLADLSYTVPHELLTRTGVGRCDVVYKTEASKTVIGSFGVVVEKAIDADAVLETRYTNVLQDHELRLKSAAKELKELGETVTELGASGGTPGPAGAAATIAVGNVTTGAPGSQASVVNAGTQNAAILNFAIPRGDTGETGGPGSGGRIVCTAAYAIGGHRIVSLNADGEAEYPADYALAAGLTANAAAGGGELAVVTSGLVAEPSWAWEPGRALYLAADGLMTQTPPSSGVLLPVGYAATATEIVIKIGTPIILL